MNGKKVHHKKFESIYHNAPAHKQINTKTPAPMKIGVMLVFLAPDAAIGGE
jgi:hypothetical protein